MDPIAKYAASPQPYAAGDAGHPFAPALSAAEEDAGVPLHPDAKRLFDRCPVARRIPIFAEATEAYGPRCTISLALCYLLCKGLSDAFMGSSTYPMFQERFGVDAIRYQRFSGIMGLGWCIKPFTAVVCDSFAFLGYTKRWYMFASCVVGSVCALGYGLLPAKPSSGDIASALVFVSSFGVANVDILSEGFYSRLIRKIPKAGTTLVSLVWWFVIVSGPIATCIQGPVSDLKMPQVGAFLSAGLQLLTCLIFVFNLYGEKTNREERSEDARIVHKELLQELEKRKSLCQREEGGSDVIQGKSLQLEPFGHSEALALADDLSASCSHLNQQQANGSGGHTGAYQDETSPGLVLRQPIACCCGLFEFNKEVVTHNKRIVLYSAVMTAAAIIMGLANFFADTLGLLIICAIASVVCCAMSFWALPLIIAKVNVYNYLTSCAGFSIAGLSKFYMGDEECVPGGPHFSLTFVYTICTIISTVAHLLGILVFNYFFSKSNYRKITVVTTIALLPFVLPEIMMLKRWNIMLGIPDHAFYIGTTTIISPLIGMLSWMPLTILLSRLCPRGSESTVFALLAGFSNLGQSTSSSIGAIMMEYVWPISSQVPCDFENGVWLVIVGHILLPLFCFPLVLLLPNARVCDDIDIDGNVIPKGLPKEPHVKPSDGSSEAH